MKENKRNLEAQLCWEITVFDKKEFVESVIERGLSLDQIVDEARKEIHLTESLLHLVRRTPVNRAARSSDHVRFLRSLVFFLTSEVKVRLANLSDDDFQILHRLTQYLVDRGDLKPEILELFGE